MCLDLCGCGRIVSSVGPKGDTGATGPAGAAGATGATGAMPTTYTTSQAHSSSNDIYGGGSGYLYQISGSMPVGTTAYYSITFEIAATVARVVTFYPSVNATPDATKEVIVVMPTAISSLSSTTVTISGFVTYVVGQTFKMQITADSATGSPVLKTVIGHYYTVS